MSSWNKYAEQRSRDLVIIRHPDSNIADIPSCTIESSNGPLSDVSAILHVENTGTLRIETIYLNRNNPIYYSLKLDKKSIRITSPNIHVPLFGTIKNYVPYAEPKIPKVIIQTWDNAIDESSDLSYPARVLKTMNPDYKYVFFNAEERREFIKNNFNSEVLAAFDKIKPVALKCDLWRYCYLYINGGVYLDIKTFTARPLFSILDRDYEMLIAIENSGKGLFNGVMAVPPKHLFMKMLIDETVKNIGMEYYGESALDITGPNMCRRIFNIYEGNDIDALLVEANQNYKYVELIADEIIKDNVNDNTAFHRVFSTYYSKFNSLVNPDRFWNAWERRDVYN
jgi:mannosyltransferase OCH1-like enzyme